MLLRELIDGKGYVRMWCWRSTPFDFGGSVTLTLFAEKFCMAHKGPDRSVCPVWSLRIQHQPLPSRSACSLPDARSRAHPPICSRNNDLNRAKMPFGHYWSISLVFNYMIWIYIYIYMYVCMYVCMYMIIQINYLLSNCWLYLKLWGSSTIALTRPHYSNCLSMTLFVSLVRIVCHFVLHHRMWMADFFVF
jgi:hypothetical protein